MRLGHIGLVGAGSLSRSFIARMPRLHERLGPVLAPSYRLASRLVNTLRAGRAAESYEELENVQLVLIAVPDGLLPQVLERLASALDRWAGKSVLLCDSREDCVVLKPLAERGAATASLTPVPGLKERYVVEGDRRAVREARLLVHGSPAQVWEMACGRKAVFQAALTFSTGMLLPAADAAARCLRATGLPAAASNSLAEQLLDRTLRAYLHGGRKAWGGVLAGPDVAQASRELAGLEAVDPGLARAYRQLARFALEWLERDPGWLERMVAGARTRPAGRSARPRAEEPTCAPLRDGRQ
ncbi:MAG: DUF2520 domain-containing protein [Bryobacterales bacterium]|nr:DUF2520 domain-containing protein [Bryobacteraceae bacterium]MDW8129292.1 DUF2520 domain-containing protein [Bryobacterales bacterium]